jgi:hypothetical protein
MGTLPVSVLVFSLVLVSAVRGQDRICSPDDWCWENPIPQGNSLNATWGSSAGDVYAVGHSGAILHRKTDTVSWNLFLPAIIRNK